MSICFLIIVSLNAAYPQNDPILTYAMVTNAYAADKENIITQLFDINKPFATNHQSVYFIIKHFLTTSEKPQRIDDAGLMLKSFTQDQKESSYFELYAHYLFLKGRYGEAANYYQKAWETSGELLRRVMIPMFFAYTLAGNSPKARETSFFVKELETEKRFKDYVAVLTELSRKNYTKARLMVNRMIPTSLNPKSLALREASYHFLTGLIYEKEGELKTAERFYRHAYSLNPTAKAYQYKLHYMNYQKEQVQKKQKHYKIKEIEKSYSKDHFYTPKQTVHQIAFLKKMTESKNFKPEEILHTALTLRHGSLPRFQADIDFLISKTLFRWELYLKSLRKIESALKNSSSLNFLIEAENLEKKIRKVISEEEQKKRIIIKYNPDRPPENLFINYIIHPAPHFIKTLNRTPPDIQSHFALPVKNGVTLFENLLETLYTNSQDTTGVPKTPLTNQTNSIYKYPLKSLLIRREPESAAVSYKKIVYGKENRTNEIIMMDHNEIPYYFYKFHYKDHRISEIFSGTNRQDFNGIIQYKYIDKSDQQKHDENRLVITKWLLDKKLYTIELSNHNTFFYDGGFPAEEFSIKEETNEAAKASNMINKTVYHKGNIKTRLIIKYETSKRQYISEIIHTDAQNDIYKKTAYTYKIRPLSYNTDEEQKKNRTYIKQIDYMTVRDQENRRVYREKYFWKYHKP